MVRLLDIALKSEAMSLSSSHKLDIALNSIDEAIMWHDTLHYQCVNLGMRQTILPRLGNCFKDCALICYFQI